MYTIDLKGRTALVVGVANRRSIAWAIARVLAQAGATLAVTYQDERLEKKVRELTGTLEGALTLPCDVTRDGEIASVYEAIQKAFGGLDFLVHSVAYAERQDLAGEFCQTSRQGYRTALEVSAYSLLPLVRGAAPLMERRGGGSVIALTFMASERVFPGYNVMGSAKAALEHAIRQLAYELGPRNIRVNGLSAGPLPTLAARGIRGFTDFLKVYRERAPLKREITHEEVAKAALFLLSDLASAVTGEVLHVDAGYHIMGI